MAKLKKIGYSLKDVTVIQAPISMVDHRGDINPYTKICEREVLPVFVAPMATVTDEKNYQIWIDNKVTPVIPRTVQQRISLKERIELAKKTFVSVSLSEAKQLYENKEYVELIQGSAEKFYICIDLAQGTMSILYEVCKKIKRTFSDKVELMSGNIANPEAYNFYCDAGIDWVRCSVGTGSRCISACNTATYYPMATLLDEINNIREEKERNGFFCTKVIADGGIGWFDDIQKSIALGADAVMTGRLFNECEEACEPYYWAADEFNFMNGVRIRKNAPKWHKRYREYYGMSTKIAQKLTGGEGNKTSEGISKPTEVKYPVNKFLDNLTAYLRSCMSYAGSFTIEDFRKNAELIILGGSGDVTYRK